MTKILVAGVGNVLWGDDGFGVEVVRNLWKRDLGPDVRVIETGIGGVHLVQELFEAPDVLIVLDAVDRERPPGTVMLIEPEVTNVEDMPDIQRWDFLADMHYAKPERAFMLAKALGVLPPRFYLVGCQPENIERLGQGLSPAVETAVQLAVTEVERLIGRLRAGLDP